MLRGAIWLFLAFAVAVVLALVLRSNHGNIAIFWPPYRIELSSNMALVLTVLGFLLLHLVLRLIGKTVAMPQRIRDYKERRRLHKSSRALQGAVLALFEGRYDRAERLAATAASSSGEGGDGLAAASLLAARSAHRLGAPARRDDWLRQASGASVDNAAALMVQAEFALDDQQPARALDAVDRMTPGGAQQPIALEAALGAYQQSGRWDRVLDTVRQLSKRGRMSARETASLRLTAYRQLLVPLEGDARAIRELWKSLRSDERKLPELAAPTVAALARAAAPDDARKIALSVLDTSYDEATAEAFGTIVALAPRQRLEQLERWRSRHGDKPKLLEMLGRICASEKLWGKAEAYLLGSLNSGDTVSARVALAQLYESIDRPRDAALQFQHAARLALGERPPLPGPAAGSLGATVATAAPGGGTAPRSSGSSGTGRLATSIDSSVPDGDVGTIPAVARPDRQELHDRLPPKDSAGASNNSGTRGPGNTIGSNRLGGAIGAAGVAGSAGATSGGSVGSGTNAAASGTGGGIGTGTGTGTGTGSGTGSGTGTGTGGIAAGGVTAATTGSGTGETPAQLPLTPASDASAPIDFEADAGDEPGVVGRKK